MKNILENKIYHVIERIDDSYGGPAVSLPLFVSALNKQGCLNQILSIDISGHDKNTLVDKHNIDLNLFNKTPCTKYMSIDLLIFIWKVAHVNKKILFHFHSVWSSTTWFGMFICIYFRVPYVLSPRSSLMTESFKNKYYFKYFLSFLFLRKIINRCSFIHATDDNEANDLENYGYKGKTIIVPHGIDILENRIQTEINEISNLKFDQNKKYILYLSRIHPRKNLDLLIKSFEKIAFKHSNYNLLVAGNVDDERYYSKIKNYLNDREVSNRIFFLGQLLGDQKDIVLSKSSFFVLVSDFENFGMAIAEALGAGLPVVIGNNNPWYDVEEHGAGYRVEKDINCIADSMNMIMSLNGDELLVMKKKCKKYLSNKSSWNSTAIQFITYYKGI